MVLNWFNKLNYSTILKNTLHPQGRVNLKIDTLKHFTFYLSDKFMYFLLHQGQLKLKNLGQRILM